MMTLSSVLVVVLVNLTLFTVLCAQPGSLSEGETDLGESMGSTGASTSGSTSTPIMNTAMPTTSGETFKPGDATPGIYVPQGNLNQGNCYLGHSKACDRPECFWYNCYGYCSWLGALGKTISYNDWVYQKSYYLGFNFKRSDAFWDVCKSNKYF